MVKYLLHFRRRLRDVFFGPAYHRADHAALSPRGSRRGVRAVLFGVGALWAVMVGADNAARFGQPGPKSWRFLQGARVLSEHPNQTRRLWPLRPIMARRLNVAALNQPYEAAEDRTPRWVTTDAYGFRRSQSAEPYEVVLAGDSFFINDVIADSVARHLGRSVGNAAVDGRGTLTMARLLDEPAPGFRQPKTVVWLRAESGVNTAEFSTWLAQRRAELRTQSNPGRRLYAAWRETGFWPNNLDGYLTESSALRGVAVRLASEANWHLWHQADTTVLLGNRALPAGVAPMQFLSDEQGLCAAPMPAADLELIADQIALVQRELAGRGVRLAFAVAPDKSTVYRERLPLGRRYRPGFVERVHAALRRRQVPVIDLATGLRREALAHPTVTLYYTTDTHWNPRGQALAAHAIADSLRRWQLLLPASAR